MVKRATCHDCGTKEGQLHILGCDMERCAALFKRVIGPLGGVSEMIGCKGRRAFGSLEYSASIASLSHIRAMSIRMD
jgi:hypothetical protein